jgi:hypothetical protein
MYGLRKDINLSFLDGGQLEQVAIGVRQVIFGFDENVRITAYSKFIILMGERNGCGSLYLVQCRLRPGRRRC